MPHHYSFVALKRTRSVALIATFICCWLTAQAQLVFVPDTNFRTWLNDLVPGAVGPDGYIDPADPVVANTHDLAFDLSNIPSDIVVFPITSIDFTGIEAFAQLDRLNIGMFPLNVITLPAWPAALHHLSIMVQAPLLLPAWPSTLDFLSLEYQIPTPPAYPDLPVGLDSLVLRQPADAHGLPSSLTYLVLDAQGQTAPALPSALLHLELTGMVFPTAPDWPASLAELDVDQCSVQSGVTALPPQLERFHWYPTYDSPLSLSSWPTALTKIDLLANEQMILPAAWPTTLRSLEIVDDPGVLQTLPELPGGLTELNLSTMNALTALPALPASLTALTLGGLPFIETIPAPPPALTSMTVVYAPLVTALPEFPASLRTLWVEELPGVHCLPLLPDSLATLRLDPMPPSFNMQGTPITCLPNWPATLQPPIEFHGWDYMEFDPALLCSVLTSTCDFVNPVASGTVFWDQNANGAHEVGEPGYPLVEVHVQPGNYAYGVGADGGFTLALPQNTYTLAASSVAPYVTSIMPNPQSAALDSMTAVDTGNDFAVVLQPNVQDLRIDAYASPARPGFDNYGSLSYSNVGTMPMSGTISLTFDADQSWVSSTPAPTTLAGNTATWDYSALQIGEGRSIQFTLHTDVSVALGTPVTHMAVIEPVATDNTMADNSVVLEAGVVGSVDPNGKKVSPSVLTPGEMENGARLTYAIHFQNTGTYAAERVIITDTLDAALDPGSFELLSSSHPCTWMMLDHGILRISFIPIVLPDSTSDERGSQGFVRFAIRTIPGLTEGTTIPNVANIYFDYNAPVITEPAVFSVDASTGLAEADVPELRLWPNPAKEVLMIALDHGTSSGQVELVDVTGRKVLRAPLTGTMTSLDLSRLAAGPYTVRVTAGGRVLTRTIVRQ